MIRVGILDDHMLIIKGIKELLGHIENCVFTGGYQSIREARQELHNASPDILLLDIHLPDGDGIAFCKELKQRFPQMKILALTSYDRALHVKRMMANGASGYLLKNTDIDGLKLALETVAAGEVFIQDTLKVQISNELLNLNPKKYIDPPTSREKEILKLIAGGYTSQEIANKLFISLKTVETHRRNLISKLQSRNMAEMIKSAIAAGYLE